MNASAKKNVVVPSVIRMTITPDKALNWLENANPNNRTLSDAHVNRLARDMKEGRWILTHEGIAFSPEGILLDGQHRLWAIVEADMPVEMHVWFNVDPAALMAIDSGKTRSLADILRISGTPGSVTTKELAVLRTMLGGLKVPSSLSASEAAKALARHGCAIAFAVSVLPKARHLSDATTRGAVARAYYSADRAKLAEFGRMLVSGIVPNAGCTSVILLRQYLQSNTGGTWTERRERYAKTERALASYLRGESLTRLYAAPQEYFPLPEETKGGSETNQD
jgi:hypothetical protein